MDVVLTGLIQWALPLVGVVVSAMLVPLVQRAVAAFEARTSIQLTDQQVQAIQNAVGTATSMLNNLVAKGALAHADVHVASAPVAKAVQYVVNAVPGAVAALGVSNETLASMIAARVYPVSDAPAPATPVPVHAVGD